MVAPTHPRFTVRGFALLAMAAATFNDGTARTGHRVSQ